MSPVVSPAYIGLPPQIIAAKEAENPQPSTNFSFGFSYNLVEHQLFQIQRLIELANFIASTNSNDVTRVVMEANPIGCDWSGRNQERLVRSGSRNEERGLLLLIRNAQKATEYRALMDRIADELGELTGQPLLRQNTWLDTYIFIAPQDSTTNYRPNRRSNFLCRIPEKKDVLFRRNKPTIFISLVHFPGKVRTVNLNLFALEPAISGREILENTSDREAETHFKRSDRNYRPQPGAKLGRDPEGNPAWYILDPHRPGKYLRIGSIV